MQVVSSPLHIIGPADAVCMARNNPEMTTMVAMILYVMLVSLR
jgi:hypothetical protein